MSMRRLGQCLAFAILVVASPVAAEPTFVNGLLIMGSTLDDTRQSGANAGRLGFFSDIYYDPARDEWRALSDRGPGGPVPAGFSLLPGVLHAYRASAADLAGYVRPGKHGGHPHGADDDDDDD